MESAQIPKQPANRKLSPMATAAFSGLVAVGLATAYGVDASRNQGFYRRNAMHTTGLMRFKLHVETPSAFPYSFSPWEKYAQIEEELLDKFKISEKDIPRQTKRIISVANDISDRVAKKNADDKGHLRRERGFKGRYAR